MKRALGIAWMFVLVLLLASCTGAQVAQSPADGGDAAAGDSVTTLRIMDSFTEESMSGGIEKINELFMEQNPDIVLQREAIPTEDMRTIVQTTLAANEAPDVIYYDTGPGFAGVLAEADLIRPMDDLYEQYGWNERIFSWTKERTTFGDEVYGVGNELEFYGGYYNMDLFDQLGISVPQTYEELLEVCQVALDNDLIPISFADQGKWPAYHTFSIVANNVLGKEKMDELLFGNGRWDDPEVVEAIRIWFEEMNQAGCFIPDAAGVSYDDGATLFYNGQALMHFTGTWLLGRVLESVQGFDVGWLFFPSVDGNPVLPPAGLGSGYFISANSENTEAAGKYLDFLFSDEAAQIWMEDIKIVLPFDVDSEEFELPALFEFAVNALAEQEMGYNIDVLTPDNFNSMMGDGFQAVLLGEKTPEEQAADLQAAWEEAIADGTIQR